ncbi:TonB family protein [Nitrospira sp. Nam74]
MNRMQQDEPVVRVRRHHAHGWAASTFIHICGLGGALILMAELERPALTQPFRFDVALVQPAGSQVVSEPAPADIPPPAHTPSPAPVRQRPVERPIQAKRVVATPQDIPRVTRDIRTGPAPVITQPAQQVTAAHHLESVHDTGQPITQAVQESRTTEERQVVTQAPAIAQDPIVAATTSMPVEQMAVERVEPVETDRMVEKERTVEQSPVIERAGVVTHEAPHHVPVSSEVEHRLVTERTVQAMPHAQADYGWLAESLWTRIEQLKRYPLQARTRHWEGKVILEAVIRDDGTIVGLRIDESSGHAILDQDALNVVKKASPLALKHPLGQPQITILVPISYNLES